MSSTASRRARRSQRDYPGWGADGETVPAELKDVPKPFLELYACFEIWRALGYPAEDIYFQIGGELCGSWQVCLVLFGPHSLYSSTPPLRFTFIAGLVPGDKDELEEKWLAFASGIRALSEETGHAIVDGSTIRKTAVQLFTLMLAKGFAVPSELSRKFTN